MAKGLKDEKNYKKANSPSRIILCFILSLICNIIFGIVFNLSFKLLLMHPFLTIINLTFPTLGFYLLLADLFVLPDENEDDVDKLD